MHEMERRRVGHGRQARGSLTLFTPDQRRDLARFLDASLVARADVIRQCFERGHTELGEMLIDLERIGARQDSFDS